MGNNDDTNFGRSWPKRQGSPARKAYEPYITIIFHPGRKAIAYTDLLCAVVIWNLFYKGPVEYRIFLKYLFDAYSLDKIKNYALLRQPFWFSSSYWSEDTVLGFQIFDW